MNKTRQQHLLLGPEPQSRVLLQRRARNQVRVDQPGDEPHERRRTDVVVEAISGQGSHIRGTAFTVGPYLILTGTHIRLE